MTDWTRGADWPPIASYSEMTMQELAPEIAMIKKDIEFLCRSNNPTERGRIEEAKNRFNLLLKIYAEKSGRSLQSVIEMYGD